MPFLRSRLRGAKFLVVTCVLEGLFPILAHYASTSVSPIVFYAAGIVSAACILFVYQLFYGKLSLRLTRPEWGAVLGVAFFIVVATLLVFVGSSMTSGINTAILLQTEIFFAFVWGRLFFRESPVLLQVFGAMAVFAGTLLILFNGTLTVNPGDALILLAVSLFPFGNMCAKRALRTLSVSRVLFLRYVLGSLVIVPLALFLADLPVAYTEIHKFAWLVACYAILILFVSKMFWYAGLRWLPVSIATGIITAAPVFALVFAFVLLGEIPSPFQISGLVCAVGGAYLLVMHSELSLPLDDLV